MGRGQPPSHLFFPPLASRPAPKKMPMPNRSASPPAGVAVWIARSFPTPNVKGVGLSAWLLFMTHRGKGKGMTELLGEAEATPRPSPDRSCTCSPRAWQSPALHCPGSTDQGQPVPARRTRNPRKTGIVGSGGGRAAGRRRTISLTIGGGGLGPSAYRRPRCTPGPCSPCPESEEVEVRGFGQTQEPGRRLSSITGIHRRSSPLKGTLVFYIRPRGHWHWGAQPWLRPSWPV